MFCQELLGPLPLVKRKALKFIRKSLNLVPLLYKYYGTCAKGYKLSRIWRGPSKVSKRHTYVVFGVTTKMGPQPCSIPKGPKYLC